MDMSCGIPPRLNPSGAPCKTPLEGDRPASSDTGPMAGRSAIRFNRRAGGLLQTLRHSLNNLPSHNLVLAILRHHYSKNRFPNLTGPNGAIPIQKLAWK